MPTACSPRASPHACIIDGARLSFGEVKKFKHNDPADLRRQMRNGAEARGRLVVVDGVFSMEGDVCSLPKIVAVARGFGAGVMLDDAHGIGVMGKTGRGTAEHFGLENEVDLIMGSFSKSMASVGGFIAGNATVIDFIQHRARTLIFSAPPSGLRRRGPGERGAAPFGRGFPVHAGQEGLPAALSGVAWGSQRTLGSPERAGI